MVIDRSVTPQVTILLDISMVLDLLCFTLIFIISSILLILKTFNQSNFKIFRITESENQHIGLILISLGSFIFLIGSLAWRASAGYIPNNILSDYLFDQFIVEEVDTSDYQNLTFIQVILRGLLISNFGLMVYSFGFGSVFDDQRHQYTSELLYIYGILNFLFTLASFLVFIKLLVTPPLAAIVYWRVISPNHKSNNQFKHRIEETSIT
ncbi:MAG: hypothetical protein GPJ54_18330 [Candidatus Heimdallarchaeota archaeon]|nr:hypothetical protein [Candidatus Heimdallarchaeota archaeon]